MTSDRPKIRRGALLWLTLIVAVAGLGVVGWAVITGWGAVLHGHPAYAVLLGIALVVSVVVVGRNIRARRHRRGALRAVGRVMLVALSICGIAALAWLRPYSAVEPALAAMEPDSAVTIEESPTQIVMTPTTPAGSTGVFFQPGALVDPRAYAAVLRPLAEAGHTVVIAKQPLGIAFLAISAFGDAQTAHPEVSKWVVGGHSLGGTVAALEADAADGSPTAPAIGLLFFASYPAGDISTSLTIPVESISGTRDGLATPTKIDASQSTLPPDADFMVIVGGSHAQFGDYGPQAGDGTAEISNDDARSQISAAAVAFVASLGD